MTRSAAGRSADIGTWSWPRVYWASCPSPPCAFPPRQCSKSRHGRDRVAIAVERRRPGDGGIDGRLDHHDPATDAALAGQADITCEFARWVVKPARTHDGPNPPRMMPERQTCRAGLGRT